MALKIFELGLKKYGGIPEYLLCYMDFMSHLNGNFIHAHLLNKINYSLFPISETNIPTSFVEMKCPGEKIKSLNFFNVL